MYISNVKCNFFLFKIFFLKRGEKQRYFFRKNKL